MQYFYPLMLAAAEHHSYRETGLFSDLILDYLDNLPALRPFHQGLPSVVHVQEAIERRKQFPTDRTKLVAALQQQYSIVDAGTITNQQIQSLLTDNTFTITTAHQCNLFLGPAYTIYKILHAIKMADDLNATDPEHHFVPVFYIGSEDADLAELNHIQILGSWLEWNTDQTGAVGRMHVDAALIALIDALRSTLGAFPQGGSWTDLLQDAYAEGRTLAEATFRLLHRLFADRGLLMLQPDTPSLKASMRTVFLDELLQGSSFEQVAQTDQKLKASGYPNQAHARPINLFYLQAGRRDRIERVGDEWLVAQSSIRWKESDLRAELENHPERFSPNVILRGLYQESILPNLVYVGGGGELAYWLQLRGVFEYHQVPFPLLQLRASIQWLDLVALDKLEVLKMNPVDLFKATDQILDENMDAATRERIDLSQSLLAIQTQYEVLRQQAVSADSTLDQHVRALAAHAVGRIEELQKKMKRAERRKLATRKDRIEVLKQVVFPGGGLQERTENPGSYYAVYGTEYFDWIYANLPVWENQFTWLKAVR